MHTGNSSSRLRTSPTHSGVETAGSAVAGCGFLGGMSRAVKAKDRRGLERDLDAADELVFSSAPIGVFLSNERAQ